MTTATAATKPSERSPTRFPKGDSFASGMSLLLMMVVAQRAIGFLRNIWFCRVLEPAELGRWNLAFSLMVLAAPLFVFGLPGSFGRYVEYYQRQGQLSSFLRRTFLATFACAGLGIVSLLAGGEASAWLTLGDADQYGLLLMVCINLVSVIAFNAFVELCTALRQVRWVAIMQFVNSLLFAAIGSLLLACTTWGPAAVVLAYGLACLVTGWMAYVGLGRNGCWDHSTDTPLTMRDQWTKIAPYATGIWISNLFTNLFSAADRFMLVHFLPGSESQAIASVGQYHSSRVLGELLISVGTLVAGVLVPYMAQNWERGNRRAVGWWLNLALKGVCLSLFAAATGAMLLAPGLFQYALNGRYADGLAVLPPTLAYCIWFSLSSVLQSYLLCAEKSRQASLGYLAGLMANIGLNAWLLPRWGLSGAVYATLGANVITLGVVMAMSYRAGFRLGRGAALALLLPGCLLGGPYVSSVILLALFASPRGQGWLFSSRERRLIAERWQQCTERFRRPNGATHPLTIRPFPSLPTRQA